MPNKLTYPTRSEKISSSSWEIRDVSTSRRDRTQNSGPERQYSLCRPRKPSPPSCHLAGQLLAGRSSQHVHPQHPNHEPQSDCRHDYVANPLAGCSGFGAVGHVPLYRTGPAKVEGKTQVTTAGFILPKKEASFASTLARPFASDQAGE